MTLRDGVLAALLTCQFTVFGREPVEQRPTFRSGTAEIAVSVAVLAGNVPIGGLRASDFELTDNGVMQHVREVAIESVPVDVTVIVDTSGSTERIIERLKGETRDIAASLDSNERFRLITINTYVHEVLPMHAPERPVPLDRITAGGTSSVYDALGVAMMYPSELGRRHLIAAMTDGRDTMSSLGTRGVRDVASRSEAVLHVLLVSSASGSPPRIYPWLPYHELDEDALRDAASSTGGRLHDLRPSFSAVRAFRNVMGEFRRSYVLRYTPTGVSLDGWHQIAVKVRRPAKYEVRARKGYFGTKRTSD